MNLSNGRVQYRKHKDFSKAKAWELTAEVFANAGIHLKEFGKHLNRG